MKKLLLFTASLLLLGGTTSSAQDWKEALKKAATAAADKATDGKLTQYALAGTWNYTGPGVKFEGGDIASEVGGAALETAVVKQLEKAYAKAGIRPAPERSPSARTTMPSPPRSAPTPSREPTNTTPRHTS